MLANTKEQANSEPSHYNSPLLSNRLCKDP